MEGMAKRLKKAWRTLYARLHMGIERPFDSQSRNGPDPALVVDETRGKRFNFKIKLSSLLLYNVFFYVDYLD